MSSRTNKLVDHFTLIVFICLTELCLQIVHSSITTEDLSICLFAFQSGKSRIHQTPSSPDFSHVGDNITFEMGQARIPLSGHCSCRSWCTVCSESNFCMNAVLKMHISHILPGCPLFRSFNSRRTFYVRRFCELKCTVHPITHHLVLAVDRKQ